jgi:endo-1,4-beta-xylanase
VVILLLVVSFFSCNGFIEEPQDWQEAEPLYEIYKGDFLLGNIISPNDLRNDPANIRFILLKRHFNTVTAENHMKPDFIAPYAKGGNYRFNDADNIVRTATENGMNVVGHTLIWHSQTPDWLTSGTSREEVLGNLNKYVDDVVKHFKGKIISWDVVNEAMRDGLTLSNALDWESCLRYDDSKWNKAIGPQYIVEAFKAARAADPDAKLYYNDYNLNSAGKAMAVYNMVKDINNKNPNVGGRPLIDGIGMQSHHRIYTTTSSVEDSINLFATLPGVKIAISELDIIAAGSLLSPDPQLTWGDEAARRQAVQYAAMFRIFLKHSDIIERVTFWGIDDGTSWRSSSRPTLLNADYSLKPAFHAVMNPSRY